MASERNYCANACACIKSMKIISLKKFDEREESTRAGLNRQNDEREWEAVERKKGKKNHRQRKTAATLSKNLIV